jgi:formamidopyrimidine-DNA glycosylase
MPELPEVETVKMGLAPVMVGAVIKKVVLNRANLRFPFDPDFAARLKGGTITALTRRAKYIVVQVEQPNREEALIMHLGMSGRFRIEHPSNSTPVEDAFFHRPTPHEKHDHVVFHLSNGAQIIYNDARRFGFMDVVEAPLLASNKHLKNLGLEPLSNDMNAHALATCFKGVKAPLKAALLDQKHIAGLGNIYVCESLFRARLHPQSPASILADASGEPTPAASRLAPIIVKVLQEAVAAGGSTLRDFAHTDGSMGYFQHAFKVYDREGEPCVAPSCSGVVERITQSGRSTYFCASCQRIT